MGGRVVGGDRRIPSYSGDYRYAREDKDVEVQLLLFSTVRRVREGGLRETRPGQRSCGDPSCAAYARSAQMKKPLSRSTFSDPVISTTDDSEDWNEEDGESSADPGTSRPTYAAHDATCRLLPGPVRYLRRATPAQVRATYHVLPLCVP